MHYDTYVCQHRGGIAGWFSNAIRQNFEFEQPVFLDCAKKIHICISWTSTHWPQVHGIFMTMHNKNNMIRTSNYENRCYAYQTVRRKKIPNFPRNLNNNSLRQLGYGTQDPIMHLTRTNVVSLPRVWLPQLLLMMLNFWSMTDLTDCHKVVKQKMCSSSSHHHGSACIRRYFNMIAALLPSCQVLGRLL